MRDDLDRALERNPDYPPGFDPRELEDAISTQDDRFEDDWPPRTAVRPNLHRADSRSVKE